MTDSEVLKKKISDSGISITFIAEKLGISRGSLYNKLNNDTEFVLSEVRALKDILRLSDKDMEKIFFTN